MPKIKKSPKRTHGFEASVEFHLKNQVNFYLWSTEVLSQGLYDVCLILNMTLALKLGPLMKMCFNICAWNE